MCIVDANSGTVEGIINSGNNHGYKYIVNRRKLMYGYNSKFFNKNLIDSMKQAMISSLSEQFPQNLGTMMNPNDFSKVSDLQLQNQMRQYKRSNIFTGDEPDEKQRPEYLAARAEYQRRQGAKAAPAAAPAAPVAASRPLPRNLVPASQGTSTPSRDVVTPLSTVTPNKPVSQTPQVSRAGTTPNLTGPAKQQVSVGNAALAPATPPSVAQLFGTRKTSTPDNKPTQKPVTTGPKTIGAVPVVGGMLNTAMNLAKQSPAASSGTPYLLARDPSVPTPAAPAPAQSGSNLDFKPVNTDTRIGQPAMVNPRGAMPDLRGAPAGAKPVNPPRNLLAPGPKREVETSTMTDAGAERIRQQTDTPAARRLAAIQRLDKQGQIDRAKINPPGLGQKFLDIFRAPEKQSQPGRFQVRTGSNLYPKI